MSTSNFFCLNTRYSTTRIVSKERTKIENNPTSKLQTQLFLPPNPERQGKGGLRTKGYFKVYSKTKPLVSIITVDYNEAKYLDKTIQSVLSQNYGNVEYIIIDGGSTDGTVSIIRKYKHAIDYWISEPDKGISDAFNKGILLATGEYIGLLNAGDWFSKNQLTIAVQALQSSSCDFVYGDLIFHDISERPLYCIRGDPEYAKRIRRQMPVFNHPTVLAKSSLYRAIGGFDINYYIAMDYEWFLRVHANGFAGLYAPKLVGHMRLKGKSDVNFAKGYGEVRDISIRYGYPRIFAYGYYFYALNKTWFRHLLEITLPNKYVQRLRQIVNPALRSIS